MQPTWDPVRELVDDKHVYSSGEAAGKIYQSIRKKLQLVAKTQKTLLVLDDLSAEKSLNEGTKGDLSWMVYNSVWLNLSLLVITHRFTAVTPALRENLEHLIVFTLINTKELDRLAEEFNVTGDKSFMKELYTTAVVSKELQGETHSFLYVKLSSPPAFYRTFKYRLNVNL